MTFDGFLTISKWQTQDWEIHPIIKKTLKSYKINIRIFRIPYGLQLNELLFNKRQLLFNYFSDASRRCILKSKKDKKQMIKKEKRREEIKEQNWLFKFNVHFFLAPDKGQILLEMRKIS